MYLRVAPKYATLFSASHSHVLNYKHPFPERNAKHKARGGNSENFYVFSHALII